MSSSPTVETPTDAVRPAHHTNSTKTGFRNPWPSAAPPSWLELASSKFPIGWSLSELSKHPKARDIALIKPDWGAGLSKGKGKSILATFLGHATAFMEFPITDEETVKLLFDPIFSSRAGPTQYTGPSRLMQAPCGVEDLPGCDAVFISHNHYDHLDTSSIMSIMNRFPKARYFVPLGNKPWFLATGVPESSIFELDWWEDVDFCPLDFNLTEEKVNATTSSKIRFTCTPAQHNSGRGVADQGATLWCGWTCERLVSTKPGVGEDKATARVTRRGAAFFAGDTGYRRYPHSKEVCPAFEGVSFDLAHKSSLSNADRAHFGSGLIELGNKLGPFDVSFIPIWRGGSLGFVSWAGLRLSHVDIPATFHGTPSDAVSIHLDVKSRNSIGIHFGTFIGNKSESLEAVIELQEACDEADVLDLSQSRETENGRLGVLDIGETLVVDIEDLAIFS